MPFSISFPDLHEVQFMKAFTNLQMDEFINEHPIEVLRVRKHWPGWIELTKSIRLSIINREDKKRFEKREKEEADRSNKKRLKRNLKRNIRTKKNKVKIRKKKKKKKKKEEYEENCKRFKEYMADCYCR
jgi:hypothetical protein